MLNEYAWPGNIRELKNIVERAIIISSSDVIDPDVLPIGETRQMKAAKTSRKPVTDLQKELQEIEAGYMEEAYEKYGNVRDAAKSLGMNASTFVRKRKKYQQEG